VVPTYHELRRADVVVATGRLNQQEPFEVGEKVVIGGHPGIVHAVYPQLVEQALRVVVQLTSPKTPLLDSEAAAASKPRRSPQ
jgi:hypothetical protein